MAGTARSHQGQRQEFRRQLRCHAAGRERAGDARLECGDEVASVVGTPNVNVTVLKYEVVGEIEREGKNPTCSVFKADLPRNVTVFEFPESFTGLAEGEMKFEIVTKLTNGNQTAVESCFEID